MNQQGHFKKQKPNIIYGIHPVLESFDGDKEIEKVFIQKGSKNQQIGHIRKICNERSIPISDVPIEKLNKITGKNHQGVIAYVSLIEYGNLETIIDSCYEEGKDPFILILDRITDVRNFGAIARTAECMGVDAILIPSKGGAMINSDAEKSAAGALNYIPICRVKFLDRSLEYLRNMGIRLIGCTEKSDKEISKIDFSGPIGIIVGSEEDGISPKYLAMCDDTCKIRMFGKVGSLNVSVASGMVLYQASQAK